MGPEPSWHAGGVATDAASPGGGTAESLGSRRVRRVAAGLELELVLAQTVPSSSVEPPKAVLLQLLTSGAFVVGQAWVPFERSIRESKAIGVGAASLKQRK